MTNLIFLDIDGVFNCQLFYEEQFAGNAFLEGIPLYKQCKKMLRKLLKSKKIGRDEYYKSQLCSKRIGWFNDLCKATDSVVVISSSWRNNNTVEQLQEIMNNSGATFTIIDKTPDTGFARGTEIKQWLEDNCMKYFGVHYFDFYNYAIIDDDSDMLLDQAPYFFKTDKYSGFTPETYERIHKFFTRKTFPKIPVEHGINCRNYNYACPTCLNEFEVWKQTKSVALSVPDSYQDEE